MSADREEGQQWLCGDILAHSEQEASTGQLATKAGVLARGKAMGEATNQHTGVDSIFLLSCCLRRSSLLFNSLHLS